MTLFFPLLGVVGGDFDSSFSFRELILEGGDSVFFSCGRGLGVAFGLFSSFVNGLGDTGTLFFSSGKGFAPLLAPFWSPFWSHFGENQRMGPLIHVLHT